MLIATTSHSIIVLDENSGIYRHLERGYGLYYGIAIKDNYYYVAARRRMVSSTSPCEVEDGEIRVFDAKFNFETAWKAPFLLRDIHQILFIDDDLFITCSYDNLVAIRRANGTWEKWYPLGVSSSEPFDLNHINSLSVINNQIALVAHNHSLPSEIYFFDKTNFCFLSKEVLGSQSHNCWLMNEDLFTCSSGEGAIRSLQGNKIDIGDFPRGIATGGSKRFVGLSKFAERSERDSTNGAVVVFDDQWRQKKKIILEKEGLVLDLAYLENSNLLPSDSLPERMCWCGNSDLEPFSHEYSKCNSCGTLVYRVDSPPEQLLVRDDETDFYGRKYWLKHQQDAFGTADIHTRARNDLTERNLHWFRALLKYRLPPAKVLELGCSHGSFVALLRHAGYDASGLEMSPWVVEFGQKTFGVSISIGPVEVLEVPPASFDVIVLMDVLEHLPAPVTTMAHCLKLLKQDGILLIQTPQFRPEISYAELFETKARFQEMLIPEEHIYLFSDQSITRLCRQLGAEHVQFEPAIFDHYDMFLAVSRTPFQNSTPEQVDTTLLATPNGRLALAMLDVRDRELNFTKRLQESESSLAARLTHIETLTAQLKESEEDRAERAKQIETLSTLLKESEEDRAERAKQIEMLSTLLKESEEDRAERARQIETLSTLLKESEEDRAERAKQIETLSTLLKESEEDRAERARQIETLSTLLKESEGDRAGRAKQIDTLTTQLKESERDRAERARQIEALTASLRTLLSRPGFRWLTRFSTWPEVKKLAEQIGNSSE